MCVVGGRRIMKLSDPFFPRWNQEPDRTEHSQLYITWSSFREVKGTKTRILLSRPVKLVIFQFKLVKINRHPCRIKVFQIDVNNDDITNHSDGLHYHHVSARKSSGEDISIISPCLPIPVLRRCWYQCSVTGLSASPPTCYCWPWQWRTCWCRCSSCPGLWCSTPRDTGQDRTGSVWPGSSQMFFSALLPSSH